MPVSSQIAGSQFYVKGGSAPEVVHLLADLTPDIRSDTTVSHACNIDRASLHGILGRICSLGPAIGAVWSTDSDPLE